MATSPATITPLTNAPSTSSPSDFDARADALLGVGLPLLVTEVNAANIVTYNNAVEAKASADAAAVSATATGATRWISGTSYALFTIVYSPLNYQAYRKITATGVTTTDPSLDATNWVSVSPISVSTAAATYVPLTGTLGNNGINLGSGGFRVTNAYYLGVGTATPLTTAHIYSGNANPLMVTRASNVVVNGASGTTIDIGALNGAAPVTAGQLGATLNSPATTGVMYFTTLTAGTLTEKMRIDSSGNVLIGTTTALSGAGEKFSINVNSTGFAQFMVQNNNSGYALGILGQNNITLYATVGGPAIGTISNDGTNLNINGTTALRLTTANTERMRIDSSGNVLIGTSGTGPLNSNSISFSPTVTGGADFNHITGTATAVMYSRFNLAGATIGSITQSGTTAVLYNTTSDTRLKTNIEPAADTGTLLDAVQVRQFDWISDGTHQRYGFVAQELVEVVPEAVHQPAEPDQMMAVDYSKLVPLLVKEIQSLRARLAKLESQI